MFLVTILYTYREPCHAVPPAVSPSRVTSYLWGQGAPFCLKRHHTHPDLNQSALCACSLGPVTPRASISPRSASFCQQQSSGDTATYDLDPAEDGHIHYRLARITQENHAIKAQLSQLTELVWQLLPQPAQAAPQSADAGNMPPAEDQAVGTPRANLGLPPLSLLHSRDAASGVSPRGHQAMLLSFTPWHSTASSTCPSGTA